MKHQIKKLTERITLLYGIHAECCIYLVEGDKRALLIDTGLGAVDMQSEIAELTSLPYDVVNTHGHGDHTGGNIYYPAVYMHEGAREDARGFLALNKTVSRKRKSPSLKHSLQKEVMRFIVFPTVSRLISGTAIWKYFPSPATLPAALPCWIMKTGSFSAATASSKACPFRWCTRSPDDP